MQIFLPASAHQLILASANRYLLDIFTSSALMPIIVFLIISGGLILGTIYFYFRLRTSNFTRTRRMLEQRVEVRTHQLIEKNKELEELSLAASKTDSGVIITDVDGIIEWANDGFAHISGQPASEVKNIIGRNILDIKRYHDVEMIMDECERDKKSVQFETKTLKSNLQPVWISSNITPVFDDDGHVRKFVFVETDISIRKAMEDKVTASLREKDMLLKEIHHRVKNNLQIIISLLNLQSGYIKDEQTLKTVKDGQNRVRTMALVHEKFYQAEELSEIHFGEYTEKLCQFIFQSYSDRTDRVRLKINSDNIKFDMDTAMPCGLLINEVVSNALKYAFPDGRSGEVAISIKALPGSKVELFIGDDGIGLPPDLDIDRTETLGLQLISALAGQLDGTLEVTGNGGTAFRVQFTYPKTKN